MSPRPWLAWLASTNAAFVLLGGCAHTTPRIETVTVEVPIVRACVPPSVPTAPASYPDDHLPTGPAHLVDRYRLGAAGNEARKARLAIVEPILAACRITPETAP